MAIEPTKQTAKRTPDSKSLRPVGRPRKNIDLRMLTDLMAEGYSVAGAAEVLGCSKNTLLNERFVEAIQVGRDRRDSKLLRAQFKLAMQGNVTMLIWLGKQWLGQSDKTEVRQERAITSYSPAKIAAAKAALLAFGQAEAGERGTSGGSCAGNGHAGAASPRP
jgi:hypothetical protein